jgi:hypothetical protein
MDLVDQFCKFQRVLATYRDVVTSAPDTLYVDVNLDAGPDGPAAVSVWCVFLGSGQDGRRLLRPFSDWSDSERVDSGRRSPR